VWSVYSWGRVVVVMVLGQCHGPSVAVQQYQYFFNASRWPQQPQFRSYSCFSSTIATVSNIEISSTLQASSENTTTIDWGLKSDHGLDLKAGRRGKLAW